MTELDIKINHNASKSGDLEDKTIIVNSTIISNPSNATTDSGIGEGGSGGDVEGALTPQLHEAIRQLFALGYKVGDYVTGRNISIVTGSNKDWIGQLTADNIIIQEGKWLNSKWLNKSNFTYAGKIHKDGLAWLEEQNYERGIYFNVNGGRDNASVKKYYAIFFESDRGSHQEQQELIDAFGLKPTVQVRTKRSNHTYFRVKFANSKDSKDLETWSKYQEKAAYVFNSDPAVKDKPRLMRLAGFSHLSIAEYAYDGGEIDYIDCKLIQCEGTREYSLDEIDNALDEYCIQQGIKHYSDDRFRLYQYIISKLNQKKNGVDYSHPKFDPNIARFCEESELEEISFRIKNFARLCERRHRGIECADPITAWTAPIQEIKAACQRDFNISTVNISDAQLREAGLMPGETLPHYFARKYAIGFTPAGEPGARTHWATCQCPHHGSSSGSVDNLHINVSDPNYSPGTPSCKSSCHRKDIMLALRQRAQDAGDPLWNVSWEKKAKGKTQPQLTIEEWKKQRDVQHKEKWRKSKNLTPTLTTNTEFFTPYIDRIQQFTLFGELAREDIFIKIPEANTIIAGCADTGAGKTTWMRLMIEKIREVCPNERWFALGYINGLLLQQCKSWRKTDYNARHFKHLQSEKAFADIRKETQDLALCVHSLKHFENYLEAFDNANIVIDEVTSVVNSILQDENIKDIDRHHILNIFNEALKRAKRVFIFDAMLSDMYTWYLREICPNKVFHIIKNENFRPKPEIEFLLGTPNLETQLSGVDSIKKADNSPICHALLNSKRFVLVSDNRTIIQILGELLKDAGKNVLVVCRETNGDADVKSFLACPNDWIQHNWIDKNKDGCILISPTGGSGIDISIKDYFTDLYGLFFGVIGVDAILQMLGRLRDYNAKFHVWVKEKGSIKNVLGTFSREIHRNVREYINHLQQMIWEGWEGDPALEIISKFSNDLLDKSNDIHFKMQCALLSQQLYEEWHLRDCVIETLVRRGYKINFVTPESEGEASEEIRHKRKLLNKQWSEDIFNAPDLTDEEAQDLRANFFQSPQQKAALKKYSLRSRLPGIEQTTLWNSDFIYEIFFENPFYLSQLECLFLFKNPELAQKKAQTRWCAALAGESLRHFDIINERYARIKALQNIGIDYFLNPDNEWDEDTPELISAVKEAKKLTNKAALPQAPGKYPVRWMQGILNSLGYSAKGSRIDSGKRRYKLKLVEVEEEQKNIILECLNRNEKYQNLGEKQKSLILQSKIAPNPCPETIYRDSTSDPFVYNKTGLMWSLPNQELLSINENTTHGDEPIVVPRLEEGHTEKPPTRTIAIAVTQDDDYDATDFTDIDNLTFIKYFAAG